MQSFNDCWWFKDLNKIFMIKETKDLKNLADYCVKKSKIYGATGCGVYVENNISTPFGTFAPNFFKISLA